MKIINREFNINDKEALIANYDVKAVRGIKNLNTHTASVYVSKNGDVLIFSLFRRHHTVYTYYSVDELTHTDKSGYPIITIRHYDLLGNKEYGAFKLHRLVACTWIDNPNNFRDVDHLDGNKFNNDVSNLEWTTHAINCKRYWDRHIKGSNRLVIECCGHNMGVVQSVNLDELKVRYRKCKYCGRRVMTKQYTNEDEALVKEY